MYRRAGDQSVANSDAVRLSDAGASRLADPDRAAGQRDAGRIIVTLAHADADPNTGTASAFDADPDTGTARTFDADSGAATGNASPDFAGRRGYIRELSQDDRVYLEFRSRRDGILPGDTVLPGQHVE